MKIRNLVIIMMVVLLVSIAIYFGINIGSITENNVESNEHCISEVGGVTYKSEQEFRDAMIPRYFTGEVYETEFADVNFKVIDNVLYFCKTFEVMDVVVE